jgi:hypothetical protein
MQMLSRLVGAILLFAVSAGVATAGRKPEKLGCPDDLAAALSTQCPCDTASNHGQYVRCVVHFVTALRRADCSTRGLRAVVGCAWRSTCGRPDAVVCCLPEHARISPDAGTCVANGGVAAGEGSACACRGRGATTSTSTTTSTSSSTTDPTTSSTSTSTSTSSTTTTTPTGTDYGYDVEFSGAADMTPGYLLGIPVVVPQASVVTDLALIAKVSGGNVVLGLYTSSGAGLPAQLVASTAATPVTAGVMEMPVSPTAIPAGTYWIAGVYDSDASIGVDGSDPKAPAAYVPLAFGQPLPNPFGNGTTYFGQRFNYYLTVQ